MRCEVGSHEVVLITRTADGIGYCPDHNPTKLPDRDRPVAGRCTTGHWAEAVWCLPADGKHYCAPCLRRRVFYGAWAMPKAARPDG